jgi:hypothetical protein
MEELHKVQLGGLEILSNCPWYSVQISPQDFKAGDDLEFICEDKGETDCMECLLATAVTTLMQIRDIQFTMLKHSSQQGLFVPTIPTRK